jgi:AbrB family looped-hinge helix DNA binding protein
VLRTLFFVERFIDKRITFCYFKDMSNVISSKYQVVIPKAIRKQLGIKPGQRVRVEAGKNGDIVLKQEPEQKSYRSLIGTLEAQAEDPVVRIRRLRDNWRRGDIH